MLPLVLSNSLTWYRLTYRRMPTWDLAVVLEALLKAPFEPLEEVNLRFLTVKNVFLLAISSFKKVGDLPALSMAPSCLEFAPCMARTFLYPRQGYVPKVPSVIPRQSFFRHSVHLPFRMLTRKSLIVCIRPQSCPVEEIGPTSCVLRSLYEGFSF